MLEPLYKDYRPLRCIDRAGKFSLTTMDELIDQMLVEDRVFDVILPRISKRQLHEESGDLPPRKWLLDSELNETGETDEESSAGSDAEDGQLREKRRAAGERNRHERDRRGDRRRSRSRSRGQLFNSRNRVFWKFACPFLTQRSRIRTQTRSSIRPR